MDLKLKKILILHASAGHGHLMAAQAVESALKEAEPDLAVHVMDALDFFPPFVKKCYVGSYVWMMKKAGWLWGICFKFSDSRILFGLNKLNRRLFNKFCGARLEAMIRTSKPDLVIATHFMPPEVISAMKASTLTDIKVLTVVTDMLAHRFWVVPFTDCYAVASRESMDHLIRLGVSSENIRVTGIPVHLKFASSKPETEAREALGLEKDLFTILFTSGGVGATAADRMIQNILTSIEDVQIVAVCGSNENLKARLDVMASKFPNLLPLGFVNNMDALMDAADILVGKAGGLTTSESLAKGKPLFIVSPVPGQETDNARILSKAGASFWVHKESELQGLLSQYMNDPSVRNDMREAIRKYSHPESARRVADLALEMVRRG